MIIYWDHSVTSCYRKKSKRRIIRSTHWLNWELSFSDDSTSSSWSNGLMLLNVNFCRLRFNLVSDLGSISSCSSYLFSSSFWICKFKSLLSSDFRSNFKFKFWFIGNSMLSTAEFTSNLKSWQSFLWSLYHLSPKREELSENKSYCLFISKFWNGLWRG